MTNAASIHPGAKTGFPSPNLLPSFPVSEPFCVQAAALPWRVEQTGLEVMLVTSRGSGRWPIPKGWPEDGEPCHKAAAREAGEEAGICGSVAPRAFGRYVNVKQRASGGMRRCRVHVFPMEIARVRDAWPEGRERSRALV